MVYVTMPPWQADCCDDAPKASDRIRWLSHVNKVKGTIQGVDHRGVCMGEKSNIHTNIDYDTDGKQISFLNLPYSPHTDAWGVIPIPVAVIKNGSGPTALLMGGNHGDEYEGPITLGRMIRNLDPAQIRGRLIFLPAANLPAVVAGQRTSPLDGQNMNRCFPGDARGSPTQQITQYIESVLFPMADVFMDLHSGGSSLELMPSGIMHAPADRALCERVLQAMLAFNAPLTVVMDTLGDTRTSTAAALRHGLVVVASELGSFGATSPIGLQICEKGVRNVLTHFGIMESPEVPDEQARSTRLMEIRGPESYVYAPENGVYESFHELEAAVEAGQDAGCVHFLDDPGRKPEVVRFQRSGELFCRRAPGRVIRGNCVGIVINDYERGQ